jgi:prevent-host-death family protein
MCYVAVMTRIGVRELRQHASRYLDLVRAGETVEVTERGNLIALLISPERGVMARDHLIASGRLLPSSGQFRLPIRRVLPATDQTASEALAELREERLP